MTHDTTDILLHYWRCSWKYQTSGPAFQFNDIRQGVRHREEFFARGNGTMTNFGLRIYENGSTQPLFFTFQVNGIVKTTIELLVSDVGTFLPDIQLPIPFLKDDLLVI